jgi:hypothetical protein
MQKWFCLHQAKLCVLTATAMKLKDSGMPLHDSVAVEDVQEPRKKVGGKQEAGWEMYCGERCALRNASTPKSLDG